MDVFDLPFNKYVGLEQASESGFLLMLHDRKEYLNHLGTVHASALFALAEATSGFFLLGEFGETDDMLPVVRKVETKYKKPARGVIFSKACFVNTDKVKIAEALNTKKRDLITVRVSLYDTEQNQVMQSDFEWFVARR